MPNPISGLRKLDRRVLAHLGQHDDGYQNELVVQLPSGSPRRCYHLTRTAEEGANR